MSKVVFELNEDGVRELMKSDEMKSILDQLGAQKAAQAGAGYSYAVHDFQKRSAANIFPNDEESARDNYENNTLLKVIGG